MVNPYLQPQNYAAWTVPQVRDALTCHEAGEFGTSAILADALLRDDRIFATLDTRVLGVLGLPFCVDPSEATTNQRKAKVYADQVESWFFQAMPESTWADVLRCQNRMGFAIGELAWSRHVTGELRPKLRVHHPQFISWSHHDASFFLSTTTGRQKVTPGDGRWVLFAPSGQETPWMNGTIRALGIPYLVRTFARRDWARRSEVEGLGVRKAKIPATGDPKNVDKFLRDVRALGAETTIRLPEGFDFSIEAPAATAADGFSKLIAHCDMAITLAILGQNLTTEVTGGSYAAASVHARVQLDRLESDVAMLATTIHDQIIVPWGGYNFPDFDVDAAPWPRWDANPPEDIQRYAASLQTSAQAMTQLDRLGVDITPILERLALKRLPKQDAPSPIPDPNNPADVQPNG